MQSTKSTRHQKNICVYQFSMCQMLLSLTLQINDFTTTGVPQGFAIGLVSFIIYINDYHLVKKMYNTLTV